MKIYLKHLNRIKKKVLKLKMCIFAPYQVYGRRNNLPSLPLLSSAPKARVRIEIEFTNYSRVGRGEICIKLLNYFRVTLESVFSSWLNRDRYSLIWLGVNQPVQMKT